ncbi:hypothetical protein BJ546DRAFT_119971 [Cryomyces antarcticus]|nr:hypothetical protein LTR04_005166 [Oleoguttula sp. CCFEE 6159]
MLSPRNTIANGSLPLDNSVHVGFVQDANFRSTFDLVWSCLVTMALCTWTVQRPSVPSPSDSDSKVLLRKAAWAALTVAAPDALTLIAAEEFFGAREQVKRFHEHGYAWWTMSHAFFGYMGGYVLVYEDRRRTIVMEDQILWLKEHEGFVVETIPAKDIAGLAHVDGLSKTITLMQLSYFLLSCLGRAIQHLDFSLFEVETLSFITTTLFTLFFWWHKPGDAETRYPIHAPALSKSTVDMMLQCTAYSGRPKQLDTWLRARMRLPSWNFPIHLAEGMATNIALAPLVALSFGAWQYAAWHYSFPTPTEQLLFRIACVLSLALPGLFVAAQVGVFVLLHFYFGSAAFATSLFSRRLSALAVGAWLYVLVRLFVMVEILVSLRSVPAGVYGVVQWSSYLPHF